MPATQLRFEPLDATFGARVTGVQLAHIDQPSFDTLYKAWLEYGLLVFSDQFMTRPQQVKFARRFGPLEFDIAAISNVLEDGSLRPDDGSDDVMQVLKGNMGWHHDSTYMPVQAKGAVFTAERVPPTGGATGFADMRAAYDALDTPTRERIENLRAHHSLRHSQAQIGHTGLRRGNNKGFTAKGEYSGYGFHDGPVSVRPLVKTHPETGKKNLIIGRHAYDIVGLERDESKALLDWLADFACQPPRVYYHDWRPGDALVWDNRRLMHQATPWPMDEPRIMWHSRIAGDPDAELALTA